METITFKVHPITPTSPRIHACNHFLKAFLIFLLLIFFLHIFLLSISYMGLLEREKKYPIIFDISILLCLSTQISLTSHFCYAKAYRWHTWLAGNSDEMVINAFLSGFFNPSRKKKSHKWIKHSLSIDMCDVCGYQMWDSP